MTSKALIQNFSQFVLVDLIYTSAFQISERCIPSGCMFKKFLFRLAVNRMDFYNL